MEYIEYKNCNLCKRTCGIDRNVKLGACRVPADVYVSYYSLHKWEEPPISGTKGSGTIFFDGCSLGCIFCQNRDISRGRNGKKVSCEELTDIMLRLQDAGAHNINLVTPTHYSPSIRKAILLAKERGLTLPIVYNTGSYDTVETILSLRGIVDVYLPDFKYFSSKTANEYSHAPDYPTVAKEAIAEMMRQVGAPKFNEQGIITKGVIVRILLLPGHVAEAKLSLKYLYETYGNKIYISLMNQYTPMPDMKPPLDRRVTKEEYRQLLDYAIRLGVTKAFVQEDGTASESFIPPFSTDGSLHFSLK